MGWHGDRGGHVWPKDRAATSADGSTIRYAVLGDDGPWIVLCAGFMCPDNFWAALAPSLAETHRVAVLNYRSIGASGDPRDPGPRARKLRAEDYLIERFAEDVGAVLDAERIGEAALVGHSMGCQVALETWRQRPDRVAALHLVAGPYASPLHTFYGSKLGVYLFPLAYFGLPLLPRTVQRGITRLPRLPIAMAVARAARALGPLTPDDGMDLYFDHFGNVDPLVILKIARGMHRFDAGPWLHEVEVPVGVLVGGRDTFCPPRVGEAMDAVLPDSELVVIDDATHGVPIEFPDEIHDWITDGNHRRLGWPAVPARGDGAVLHGPVDVHREVRPA